MTTVSEYILERVTDLGVRHVFLIPGGGSMHLVDALARNEDLEAVTLLHEQSVGVAAEAYGQFGDVPGIALVTTGPGGTNALTATAAAWLDSTPCLFISGQVKRADLVGDRGVRQFGFQEIDIVAMATPITKSAIQIVDVTTARAAIDKAIITAMSGRPGPVWIDVPLDVQAAELPDDPPLGELPAEVARPSTDDIETVASLISRSRRPLLLLGNGVRLAGASDVAVAWARRLGLPVATTWKALDLVAWDDPLFAGRPGAIGSFYANFAQQGADLILAVGARLDLGQTGYRHDTFGNTATKVVVDIDAAELAKLDLQPYIPVAADAGAFFVALDAATLTLSARSDWDVWLQRISDWRARFPLDDPAEREWTDGLSLYVVMDELSRHMTPEYVFVPGSSGACSEVSMQAFKNVAGQRVLNSEGLGPMGFGIPAAIGGCLASGRRPTVCVDGDGGFAMNLQDLASVARLDLPITFFVLDNNGYGSIRATADNYFDGRRVGCDPDSGLRLPDYPAVGPAFDIATWIADDVPSLQDAMKQSLGTGHPSLVVVKISPRQVTRPRASSRRLPDGRMETAPLEFLQPMPAGLDPARELRS